MYTISTRTRLQRKKVQADQGHPVFLYRAKKTKGICTHGSYTKSLHLNQPKKVVGQHGKKKI